MEKIEYSWNPYLLEENYKWLTFKLKKSNCKKNNQYVNEIYINNKYIWYLYFNYESDKNNIEFIWIFLNLENRGLWISKIIFDYFNLLSIWYFNASKIVTVTQKKPLTASILTKYWYSPINPLIEWKRMHIWRIIWDSCNFTWLYPESEWITQKISKSLILWQRLRIVESVNMLLNPVIIWYNKKYQKILNP